MQNICNRNLLNFIMNFCRGVINRYTGLFRGQRATSGLKISGDGPARTRVLANWNNA